MSELQQTNVDGTLENLADKINAEHRACDAALRSGLAHALKAGELLVEAKTHTRHGEWGNPLMGLPAHRDPGRGLRGEGVIAGA